MLRKRKAILFFCWLALAMTMPAKAFCGPVCAVSAPADEDTISSYYYLNEVVIKAPSKEIIAPQKLEGVVLE
ncbi:MAG: hypothetical protein K2J57_05155, partial [Bacteroidales bacterium]|nr:hypothetical protein [Bacteroidales bacterium]